MIRILIVDDQNFTRQAVKSILEQESDFEVVGQAENGIKALTKIAEIQPDVIVVDLEMPEMNGFLLTQKIQQQFSHIKVIILSSHDDRDSINSAVKAGAKGYLIKDSSAIELIDTIRSVQRGYFQLGPGLFEQLLSGFIQENSNTIENLSQLENKSQDYFARLEKEIKIKNEQTRHAMYQELVKQIDHLKTEFRQGLGTFQYKVSNQLKARDFEHQKQLNNLCTGTKRTVSSLEKQVTISHYFLIFLTVSFFVEKLAKFVF